jgi:glycosyltransferase involved in cell wall biosynthesis
MPKQLVLSVCMIVKDEEKNLERCLDSLQSVLGQIPSELIIVDTGSSDRTVEIARRYTDRVYFHEWNNHFSEMRNISISYATGKWIFIYDADEELDNPESLINLFSLPKLNNYNTVRFQAKNILSYKNPRDIYHVTERLFRNDGEFCYTGTVHNQPQYKHPVLNTDILINHYGYNNDDAELMEKKFIRTSALLLKELELDPNNVYYLFQLARSYLMHKDFHEALEYIVKAYNLVETVKDEKMLTQAYHIYGEYVRILHFCERHEKCIEIAEKSILLSPQYIDLYYYKACSLQKMNILEESIEAFIVYLRKYDDYLNAKLDMTKYTSIELYSIDPKVATAVASQVISYYLNKEQYEEAHSYLRFMDERAEKCVAAIRALLKLERYEDLAEFYNNIQNKDLVPGFIACLEYELKSLETDQIEQLSKAYSKGNGVYEQFNAIRASENKRTFVSNFLDEYVLDELPIEPYAQVLMYAIESGVPTWTLILKKMKDSHIKLYIKYLMDRYESMRSFFEQFVLSHKLRSNDFQSNRMITAICNVLLLTALEESKGSKAELSANYHMITMVYFESAINYISLLYQTSGIRLRYNTLDNTEHQFYILLSLAQEAINLGQLKKGLDYYQQAAEVYPFFTESIKTLIASQQLGVV